MKSSDSPLSYEEIVEITSRFTPVVKEIKLSTHDRSRLSKYYDLSGTVVQDDPLFLGGGGDGIAITVNTFLPSGVGAAVYTDGSIHFFEI